MLSVYTIAFILVPSLRGPLLQVPFGLTFREAVLLPAASVAAQAPAAIREVLILGEAARRALDRNQRRCHSGEG